MTGFTVEYSEESVFQLRNLDTQVAKRIIQKIEDAKDNPRRFFKGLSGRKERKLRIGDYRVIADIDENKSIIYIRSLGHRRNIYK